MRALNTLIKINANISQVDGKFGTVYNTHTQSINNVSIKGKALMERGERGIKRAADRPKIIIISFTLNDVEVRGPVDDSTKNGRQL